MLVARLLGFQSLFGLLTGGATAICGASAALALSAALPAHPLKERATLFTVIGVSALSTLAMIVYPMLARAARPRRAPGRHLPRRHDPRRGAGGRRRLQHVEGDRRRRHARQADARGDAAAGDRVRGDDHARAQRRDGAAGAAKRPPLLPWFAVAFAVLVAINSTGWLPVAAGARAAATSRAGAWWRRSPASA